MNKLYLLLFLFLIQCLPASIVTYMTNITHRYRPYSSGVMYEYGSVLTAGQTNAWVILPKDITQLSIYLKMDGTTNNGIVEFTHNSVKSLTNEEIGWPWVVGAISATTNADFIYPGLAVRARSISNKVTFYVVAR